MLAGWLGWFACDVKWHTTRDGTGVTLWSVSLCSILAGWIVLYGNSPVTVEWKILRSAISLERKRPGFRGLPIHLQENCFREGLIKSRKMPSAAEAAPQEKSLQHG